jgi:hypothetical protein
MLATIALLALVGPCLWVLKAGPRYDPNKRPIGPLPGLPADYTVARWTTERKVKTIKGIQ